MQLARSAMRPSCPMVSELDMYASMRTRVVSLTKLHTSVAVYSLHLHARSASSDENPCVKSLQITKRAPKHNDKSKVKGLTEGVATAKGIVLGKTVCHSPNCNQVLR